MSRNTSKPSRQEMTILSLLWEQGPLTARQVLQAMPDKKARAYTSVLSVLQAMERKGLVTHSKSGLSNVYTAKVQREHTLRPMLREMVQDIFGGSPVAAMQQLLSTVDIADSDLEEIQALLNEHRAHENCESDES